MRTNALYNPHNSLSFYPIVGCRSATGNSFSKPWLEIDQMLNAIFGKRRTSTPSSRPTALIEGLESRQFLSASPIHLSPITPHKILAPNTGYETVTIHNLTAEPVTEPVTITLTPSLDGVTAAGAYTSDPYSNTITLKKHGSEAIKVAFTPPITLVEGKYHTLVSVDLNGTTIDATAPGTYTLTIPPAPTETPSLIGRYTGLTHGSTQLGSGGIITHEYGFIWTITGQTINSLTGTFTIGDQTISGTMTGEETTTGTFTWTLASSLANYTVTGTVNSEGTQLKGIIHGTLVDNLFNRVDGHFTLTLDNPQSTLTITNTETLANPQSTWTITNTDT
jgi:hypothetical protein